MIAFIPEPLRTIVRNILLSLAVIAAAFSWLKIHDHRIKSRVIQQSKTEAQKDVATAKNSYSSSLSAAGGVRSNYRRD